MSEGSEKISEKVIAILGKIKKDQWKAMGETVLQIRDFAEAGGVGSIADDLKASLSLQVENALSPLFNEVSELIAKFLKPILPAVMVVINEITDAVTVGSKSWTAILTGQWDTFFAWMNKNMSQDMINLKNKIREFWDITIPGLPSSQTPFINRETSAIVDWWMTFWEGLGWR